MRSTETKQEIMIAARRLAQSRGYHALSFRELAIEVGIKSASIHYYFPTKGDLGVAIAREYTDDLAAYLAAARTASPDLSARLQAYTDFFRAALLQDNRMCLCGFMAAERDELPPEVGAQAMRFAETNIAWLTGVLDDASLGPAPRRARALGIFTAVGGAQLIARGSGSVGVFDAAIASYRAAGLLP